jgi:phosphoenolpyruvate carboxylase
MIPLKNVNFCLSSRKAKTVTTQCVFKGMNDPAVLFGAISAVLLITGKRNVLHTFDICNVYGIGKSMLRVVISKTLELT